MSVWAGALADLVLVLHLTFILYAITGGLLALRFRRAAWLHLPMLAWAALTQFLGWICPLTPLENGLRRLAGRAAYGGSFIEHYLVPIVYPTGLTTEIQWALGFFNVAATAVIYTWILRSRTASSRSPP